MLNAHMSRKGASGEPEGVSWGRVPFIALKGSDDELPLLNLIRGQIDAYDQLQSKSTDGLLDDADPIIVLRNVSPDVDGLIGTRNLLKNSRIATIDENGGAEYLQVHPDINAVQVKLEHLRKDIREFGAGVDTQDVKFGSNPSGVALRSMYQDLDIYTNNLETEFATFVESLKYFFDLWLEFRGVGSAKEWRDYRVTVKLDRDMMINEGELISNTATLQALVSQETLDEYNPAVKSHTEEQARRDAEAAKDTERRDKESETAAFLDALNAAKPPEAVDEDTDGD